MTVMTMSAGEISRFDTLMRVQRGELRVMDAMALLGLARSQVFKLLARLRDEGPSGLISRKRGRPSNRRFSDAFRERVIAIVRARYADFGPTLAAEYLAERHGISISHEALRLLMMEAGLWTAKRANVPSSIRYDIAATDVANSSRSTARTATGSRGAVRAAASWSISTMRPAS